MLQFVFVQILQFQFLFVLVLQLVFVFQLQLLATESVSVIILLDNYVGVVFHATAVVMSVASAVSLSVSVNSALVAGEGTGDVHDEDHHDSPDHDGSSDDSDDSGFQGSMGYDSMVDNAPDAESIRIDHIADDHAPVSDHLGLQQVALVHAKVSVKIDVDVVGQSVGYSCVVVVVMDDVSCVDESLQVVSTRQVMNVVADGSVSFGVVDTMGGLVDDTSEYSIEGCDVMRWCRDKSVQSAVASVLLEGYILLESLDSDNDVGDAIDLVTDSMCVSVILVLDKQCICVLVFSVIFYV